MASQYADDANLAARQRLWACTDPPFDLVAWMLDLAAATRSTRFLDVGCGNGRCLAELRRRGVPAVGCDLSIGMVRSGGAERVVVADAAALPFASRAFDRVVASHMLYHVEDADRPRAIGELRRVLQPGGTLLVSTNGRRHRESMRALVESAVATGWRMVDRAVEPFSLENGAAQLRESFAEVSLVPAPIGHQVVVRDADIVAGYVASLGDELRDGVALPWSDVVREVRARVAAIIARDGAFVTIGDTGCFVCS